jgi:hypothetical protein
MRETGPGIMRMNTEGPEILEFGGRTPAKL